MHAIHQSNKNAYKTCIDLSAQNLASKQAIDDNIGGKSRLHHLFTWAVASKTMPYVGTATFVGIVF